VILVRPETSRDHAAIAGVNRAAFGGDDEARLVEYLRADGLIIASLVAVDAEDRVVGHVLFSPVGIATPAGDLEVASLAPIAVAPPAQGRGIGSRLIEHGLRDCRDAGYTAAIVVGHPGYYPRFGFSHAVVRQFANPFASDEAFMGIELAPGSLRALDAGRIVYPDAFGRF
jgi:putative acetyltransferase